MGAWPEMMSVKPPVRVADVFTLKEGLVVREGPLALSTARTIQYS